MTRYVSAPPGSPAHDAIRKDRERYARTLSVMPQEHLEDLAHQACMGEQIARRLEWGGYDMGASGTPQNPWAEYELRKSHLPRTLTADEHERECARIAKELGL
jgi:hypothetical protein